MVTEAVNSLLQFSTGLEIPRPPCLTGNANMERSKSDTFLPKIAGIKSVLMQSSNG